MKNSLKIFLINLKRDKERKKFCINQFKEFGVKYNIFDAYDGSTLSRSNINKYSSKLAFKTEKRELAYDEIGCSLSHLKIYEKIVREKISESLILEDDIIINKKLFHIIKKIPNNVEFINFKSDAKQKKSQMLDAKFYLTKFRQIPNRTCAIYLKFSAAKKLYLSGFPIKQPADGLTGRLVHSGKIKGYGVLPELIKLRKIKTSISGRGSFFLKYKFLNKIRNFIIQDD